MDRRQMLLGLAGIGSAIGGGCANSRYSHLLKPGTPDMLGSHDAGAGVWYPLVDESVAKLLSRCPPGVQQVGFGGEALVDSQGAAIAPEAGSGLATGTSTICFVGIENKSAEELNDFKDQIYERIDQQINRSQNFRSVSRRMIDVALMETRLRPDSLFIPANRDLFVAALGRQGMPIDTLMYATITSGTTDRNHSSQRDYLLTLEMVNLQSGEFLKESATLSKGYHKTRAGKWWNFGLGQGDG
ncbi:MAG: hypothetical protein RI963_1178 [Planctomycetota bacterium]